MSQGQVIKGKTVNDENIAILVDAQGRLYLNPASVGGGGGLTDAELRATPVEVTDPAVVTAIENISIPAPVGGATSEEQIQQEYILEEIAQALQAIASARGVLADLRVSIVGGAVTITSGTITTVTTVATLTNQAQVGGFSANNEIPALMNIAAIQSNINNVVVT